MDVVERAVLTGRRVLACAVGVTRHAPITDDADADATFIPMKINSNCQFTGNRMLHPPVISQEGPLSTKGIRGRVLWQATAFLRN